MKNGIENVELVMTPNPALRLWYYNLQACPQDPI